MAILHVVQYSRPDITSGYTLRTHAIVTTQQKMGLEPLVLTSPRHPSQEETTLDGVPHYRCQPERPTKVVWIRDARRVRQLAERIVMLAKTRGDIRLLHAHSPVLCGVAALRAGRQLGVPVVYEVRGLWEEAMLARGGVLTKVRYRTAQAMETKVCREVEAVVAISQGLREEFISRGIPADKISVVPNGVEVAKFTPETAPRDWRVQHGIGVGPLLLYLGALRAYEGIELLLEAFPQIRRQYPAAHLLIVGDGEASARIAARVQALQEGVTLLPSVPHDETPALYAAADIVVYPRLSTRATECVTPLKPLEAMAMGKIILASDVGGLRELLCDGKTARLFPAGSVVSLTERGVELLAQLDAFTQLGRAAREEIRTRYDWSLVVSSYKTLYARAGFSC